MEHYWYFREHQVSSKLGHYDLLWHCSLPRGFWAVVLFRLPQVFVLLLLGCSNAQASPGIFLACARLHFFSGFPSFGLVFAELSLYTGSPQSLSCLWWAVIVQRIPLVLVLPLALVVHRLPQVLVLPFLDVVVHLFPLV